MDAGFRRINLTQRGITYTSSILENEVDAGISYLNVSQYFKLFAVAQLYCAGLVHQIKAATVDSYFTRRAESI